MQLKKKFFNYRKNRKKCKYCGTRVRDWDGPGYIDLLMEKIVICGNCFNKKLEGKCDQKDV